MLMVMISTRVPAALQQAVHVVERLGDRAVAEQHDAVGDTDRHDLGERRAAERLAAVDPGIPAPARMLSVPVPWPRLVNRPAEFVAGVVRTVRHRRSSVAMSC